MLRFRASIVCATSALALSTAAAQEEWFRDPALSPDGQTIVFNAYGDLWKVPAAGGDAVPLTLHDSWDGHAVWSRDGSKIAFASDRFGDLDIFVMNADGSGLKRLTYHSSFDQPTDFSPDGERILFSSSRGDDAEASYFPTGALPELYEVDVAGGTPTRLMTAPAMEAKWSPSGDRIAYREEKSYESDLRQRDVSSFARDIWVYSTADGSHTKVTDNPGGDHSPVWAQDGLRLFTLSELDGNRFGIASLDMESQELSALTTHGDKPARGLSIADDGLMVTSVHGSLFTFREGEEPQKVAVRFPSLPFGDVAEPMAIGPISEFDVSPDGKEIAFISRGEVFVTSTDFGATTQVTDTPEQERSLSFGSDGRSLVYAAERGGSWAIFESSLDDDAELRFSAATAISEKEVYRARNTDAFQPVVSPDGEKIAFLEGRDAIRVMDRDGSNPTTIFEAELNYSYSDGDISFDWSPDSQWLTADFAPRGYIFYTDIGIAKADGSEGPQDISLNGYYDGGPQWHSSGDVIMWYSDRYGDRSHGSWGGQGDIVAAFLTQGAWDRFNLNAHDQALLKEAEESSEEDEAEEDQEEEGIGGAVKASVDSMLRAIGLQSEEETEEFTIDFDNIEDRTVRLTVHSSYLGDAALTDDLSTLYYLTSFEGGYDLWSQDLTEGNTTKVAALGANNASMQLLEGGESAIILADGRLMKLALPGGAPEPVSVDAEMLVHGNNERAYLFEHVWRQVQDKFYDPDFHGLDWDKIRADYEPKVAAVSSNRDFARLMEEMLGELNASHTGMYYTGENPAKDDYTAALGAILEVASNGLVISEVLPGGPLDKDGFDVGEGDRIVAIDGERIDGGQNAWQYLNRKAGDRIRLRIASSRPGSERDITVRTFSRRDESELLYDRWIDRRRAIVEERSNGRIGYLHVRSMDDGGFRQTFAELMGRNFDKEAIVVDTRFNGGGWLHDDRVQLLDGERYFDLRPRGRRVRGAPEERWAKPSIVVMNEGNYSNAHMFPYAYQLLGLGKLVGMPVPGTATAVWWERQMTGDLFFGIPQLPVLDQEGNPLENQTLMPDIMVDNSPEAAARGDDKPLEAAVDALLEELDQ